MRKIFYLTALSFVLTVYTGCESQQSSNEHPPASGGAHDLDHGDEHKGPHDGHVIELGRNHEYHAEIVEDEGCQLVTVYILGDDMKELSIASEKLTMSLMKQPRTPSAR
jgi:hypothetical protein